MAKKKPERQKFVPLPDRQVRSEKTIMKEYDKESGCWRVSVFIQGEWIEVSQLCEEIEADDCIQTLRCWNRGE